MLTTRYYDSIKVPAFDLFDHFRVFDDFEKRHQTDTLDDEGIKIELPGVKATDVDITLEGKTLSVIGKTRHGKDFKYVYSLKPTVDESSVTANLKDGLLSITLPKRVSDVPRKIKVT